MLIRQTGVIFVMSMSVVALIGCSSSGDRLLQIEQDLADARFASATANALEKIVAREQRFDSDGQGASGLLYPDSDFSSGSGSVVISQSSRDGGVATGSIAADIGDNGELEFYVEIVARDRPDGHGVSRFVDTSYRHGSFEGFSQSYRPITDHGLGDSWQGASATNTYRTGETLRVNFYTDAGTDDALGRPYANEVLLNPAARHDIVLHDVPPRPASYDWRSVGVPDEGLAGSLDGIEGRFSCPAGTGCYLGNERLPPDWDGYHQGYQDPDSDEPANLVIFTPADGSPPVSLRASDSRKVPAADYLSFGSWLYVPADETDAEAFEVGVFAAGGDPFLENNLMPLTGTATYTGKAAGLYAAAARPVTGSFYADVELTADFGTAGDFGTMSGSVSNFVLDTGESSPLTALRLATSDIGLPLQNDGAPLPDGTANGGWVEGTVADGEWHGVWGGRFFGNGNAADHPTSFAGTFGATDGNHNFAGGFGAHRDP